MKLTCDCCGFTQEFDDAEEAFDAGWDAPPHFTGYIACDLCPGALVVLGKTDQHASIHERWAREGRPVEFTQETCLTPEMRVPDEALDQMKRMWES